MAGEGAAAAKGAGGKTVAGHIIHKIVVEIIINGTIMTSIHAVGYHGAAYLWAGVMGAAVGAPVAVLVCLGSMARKADEETEGEKVAEADPSTVRVLNEEEQAAHTMAACCAGTTAGAATSIYCTDLCLPLCGDPSSIILQTIVIRELSCQAAPLCAAGCVAGVAPPAADCAVACRRKLKPTPTEDDQKQLDKEKGVEMLDR